MKNIDRYKFLGTWINATNLCETIDLLKNHQFTNGGYVCFPDSSVLTRANGNKNLQNVLNNSILTLPDGKPAEFYARLKGYKNVSTVSGYWLCKNLLDTNLTHFFLGSTQERLTKIKQGIELSHPKAKVIGYRSMAFRTSEFFQNGRIQKDVIEELNNLKPDLIWVGLSSPKQDFLMKFYAPMLNHGIMLGIGGVFDYLSGDVLKSPEWIKIIGLRWVWRLVREPKRLGPKYGKTIYLFAVAFFNKIEKKIILYYEKSTKDKLT